MSISNRLAGSISPYLEQHSGNPVHWQPWDAQSLREARDRQVPLLLSVGYASCHWCHVMEHESFNDAQTAQLMNELFVCVKVDREERPDIDKTYQEAHYLLSRSSGGWPLTVFLAPDLTPFFTGTYFPPRARGGMPAFREVLLRVSSAWRENKRSVTEQNRVVRDALAKLADTGAAPSARMTSRDAVDICATQLGAMLDMDNGGLGGAPKFPQVPSLQFLLAQSDKARLGDGLHLTLEAMAAGGLHDHLGGGFFRYCVDPCWDIPHFEKMLSDNAQLVDLYARASATFGEPRFARLAERTALWMLDGMRSPEGGFYSSLDADSEEGEGEYYCWGDEELARLLDERELKKFRKSFNITAVPNFGIRHHLRLPPGDRWAPQSSLLAGAAKKLLAVRSRRASPGLDDKVVAANCGMAAAALARAGVILNKPGWLRAARTAVAFADNEMIEDGVMRTVWRNGSKSASAAFLDDHAHLLDARLSLLGERCIAEDAQAAIDAARLMLDRHDGNGGALQFVSRGAEKILRTLRVADDGPAPAGNAVAARCLLRLGWLFGEEDLLRGAETILSSFSPLMDTSGTHCPSLMQVLADWHDPPATVVVAGEPAKVASWKKKLRSVLPPGVVLVGNAAGYGTMPGPLGSPVPGKGVRAHVCRADRCGPELRSVDEVLAELRSQDCSS